MKGLLKRTLFLILSQESEESPEIFESVLQNLIDHIIHMEYEDTLFNVTYRVLDKWRIFFSRGDISVLMMKNSKDYLVNFLY